MRLEVGRWKLGMNLGPCGKAGPLTWIQCCDAQSRAWSSDGKATDLDFGDAASFVEMVQLGESTTL